MAKRRAACSADASSPILKKAKTEVPPSLPLKDWRVVITGHFVQKPRSELEVALKAAGVAVTGAVSNKTTHLILGDCSKNNEFGKLTGVGSTKHKEAIDRDLSIISESQIWSVLNVNAFPNDIAYPPLKGSWLGLSQLGEKNSTSGRARCRGCDKMIAKGAIQIRFCDHSLFRMLSSGKNWASSIDRNFVHTPYPGFATVGRVTFFVHSTCVALANEKRRLQFDHDWAHIRGYILNNEYYI